MSDFPASTDERIKLLNRNEQDAKAVIDNETIPANLRFEAERTMLGQWLDNPELVATVGQAAELDRRIESYLQKNPAESRIRSFQLARAGLLIRVDKQKGITFLEQLSLNSEPKLASSAKAQLEKVQLVGKPLELTFTTTKGDKLDLQTDYHGKVVLIDFWASWCPDCIRELPTVQEVYGKYKDEGFAVIGISLDKDAKALSNFVSKKSIPWPQYFDGKGWDNELSTKYGISEIPEMWLIDREGHLVSTQITMGQLDDRVAELLNSSGKVSAE
jgi:thiol-disulfide isomerase/thioredoxin